jgi:acetyltransferase-like isoleucine patch superfamily enzyme
MLNKQNTNTDYSGFVFTQIRRYRLQIFMIFSNFVSIAILKGKNIKFGSKIRFIGIPYFQRSPNTKIEIGNNCVFRSDKTSNLIGIKGRCIISTFGSTSSIYIGNNCGFSGTVIGAKTMIYVGNNVLCGANTVITDFDWHPVDPIMRHTTIGVKSAPIFIMENVWLGLNVVVLKGVTIGENSIIGPNSVVVKDIPANVVAAGNPCKVIKSI